MVFGYMFKNSKNQNSYKSGVYSVKEKKTGTTGMSKKNLSLTLLYYYYIR